MKKIVYAISTIYVVFLLFTGAAFAIPEVSIEENITVSSNETQVDIPINISSVSGAGINGYMLRLDYDSSELSNPTLITSNTLSENLDVQGSVPVDIFGGKYSIALFSGFNSSNDGVLIKLRLDVSSEFESSNISFILEKSTLFDSNFETINTDFSNGSLILYDPPIIQRTTSIPTMNEYGIIVFISLLLISALWGIKHNKTKGSAI